MKKIRWCIVGCGGIADRRAIPGMILDPQNDIVAVMDAEAEIAKAVAQKYGVKEWFDSDVEMLDTVECDAVYIATPVWCHYSQAMLALEHKRNVFIEKPITLTKAEGKKLVDAFKKAGLQLTVGYMMGYHNLHVKTANIIKNGGIGDVNLVRMQFSCWYPDIEGAWRQKKATSGGGCIMDLAVHCMELFYKLTGDSIEKYTGYFTTKTFNYEVEDSAVITFRSRGGIIGHIDVNFNVPDSAVPSRLEILGTAGSILAEGTLGQTESGKLRYIYAPQGDYEAAQARVSAGATTYYGAGGNIYKKQFAAFNKLIASGKTCYKNADLALEIQTICDDIYKNNKF